MRIADRYIDEGALLDLRNVRVVFFDFIIYMIFSHPFTASLNRSDYAHFGVAATEMMNLDANRWTGMWAVTSKTRETPKS